MLRLRPLAVFLSLALALCLLGLWGARSQTGTVRRVTSTTAEGLNLNPSLSGNGRRIAFESTEDVAGAGGGAFFRAIRADISRTPAAFVQMAGARAPAPGISQDGSVTAFAAKEDPLGTNPDGNSEIFLHNGTGLRQVTNTTPNDISRRASDGNYQPSLSDDGRYIAFSSNRNLTGQNADGNFEIFVFDAAAGSFSQLTNTAGGVGATDAKISGNGARVAYIRDSGALPAVQRDLMLQDRTGGVTRLAADNVTNLALTHGRAISDDGSRVVFAGDTAANSSQVFLYDARNNSARAVTSLGARDTEVPLHPTISGDGTRVAFAARRTVPQLGGNGDRSIELYTYDIPTGQFAVVTDAPSNADGFQGSTRVAEVVSSLSDDGSVVAFNFPRALSEEVLTGLENNSEIYVSGTAARPTEGTLEVLNGASFGREPSTTEAVAPESYAVATGGALSFETVEAESAPDGSYPTTLGGTTVTVNNLRAEIVSVSPTRVDFLVPAATAIGTATVVVTNEEGFRSVGTVEVKTGAPGIFTKSGDGTGEGDIVNAQTGASGPFDPTNGELRLIIFTTGVRNAAEVTARAGGHALPVESVTESATRPGTDEVRVRVPAELRGAGSVDLFVRADDRDSNPVTVTFAGVAPRPDIVINEVLADPPTDDDTTAAIEGDANRDGVRDTSQDEFVELVNATGRDINLGGYQLFTRGTTAANDTLRHTFAAGTILPAGAAVVVFGGGNPNPRHPAFGGAQVFTASEGELSLVNTGGVVTLRDANQTLVTIFSYGGSTGLDGGSNQSLTRSPDITGAFTLHTTASGSNGSAYSPGTRVSGQPFTSPAIARIEVSPASATIAIGQKQQFTATAYNAAGNPMPGVIFTWESSNTAVAGVDENGLATGVAEGTAQIRARARGVTSAPATLTVRFVPRTLTSVEVTPSTATIPVGGQRQFTARGLDQFGNEMAGLTFTWESTDASVATVDQNGLASGVGIGTTTIRASTGGKTGTATLDVTAPKIVINEALADPPGSADTDLQGDANRDGERDASQDEFVELVNNSTSAVDISGWTVRTRSLDGTTETLRHTFAAGTTVPAKSAVVVFGGGNENFDPSHPAFGCAQVVKSSSGRLSLLNSGETIVITDANGNLTAQLTYGSAAGLNGGSDQSLTRSPDVTGDFTLHTAAANSGGRRFSPGVKVDGTPFGNCPARLTSVTISPTSQSVIIGRTTQFTAQARDQFGRPMRGVTITFTSDNTGVATVDSVTTNSTTGVATATVRGRGVGTAHITARATSGATSVESDPATLSVTPPPPRVTRIEVTPASATVNRGGTQKFTAKAFNGTTQVSSGVTFTWTSSNENVATVDQTGLATGVGIGTVTVTATAPDGLGGTVSDTAQLTVRVPLVINEMLADVPTDNEATPAVEGDANRDGTRSSDDDEFIELLNNTNAPVDLSGVIIADGTSNRFTIPAGTILAGGRAVVIFGGGSPPSDDPAFGGALVLKLTGSLSLNDTGDTVNVKLPVGGSEVVIAAQSYGSAGGAARANDQSLARSPDAEIGTSGGEFVPHTTATNAAGRVFSPGTRADGTPFGSPAITRIQVTPASATVNVGGSQVFTARAFSNAGGTEVEVKNVSFIWDATDPSKAAVAPTTGPATTATARAGGSTMIRAQAGGKTGAGTLNINFPPVSRIEVTPATATIPVGGARQFTARAFDANNQEIAGVPFTWSSSNTNVATVDQNGLATGVAVGTATIKAAAGGKSGTATLNVVARTVTINEVLADPPEGLAGDANRDGVRDSSDDEFVELVNALNTSVNISGWTLRTRGETATAETVRHTFAANTTLPANGAVVLFGGGAPNASDPAFGGSQVLKVSTSGLSLTNTALTITLRDSDGNLVAQFAYGGSTGLNAGKDQSLTRSPDITGNFVLHTQAPSSDGRVFSPGTRVDGTPFGSPPITRIQVAPASATVNVGATRVFTARAFSNTSGTEVEVFNVSFLWDSSDPARASVSPRTGRATTATALSGGSATIRARAGGQAGAGVLNINFPPVARIEVTPSSATIPVGGTLQFTARAFDAGNQEITGLTFTWTSSNTSAATVDSNGLATGVGEGTTTITASAKGKSGTASLAVVARTVTINEVLADPPEGLAGDANRDGVRDSSDDEFVELVNGLNASVNISGWTLRTRSLTGTSETVRHTFAANTTLPANGAVVLFGGGSPNQADPAFGGSQVIKVSTSGLSLTNSGLHVVLRDAAGNLVTQFTYGSAAGVSGDKDQSTTRSPDITGNFVLHTAATNAAGRVFSPGTRTDGTPFGSPPITRIQVTPASATVNVGGTRLFTARAFSNTTGTEIEVLNVSFIWDSSDPARATVSPQTGKSTTATAHAGGTATIRARAGGQAGAGTLNINFPPVARVEVTPSSVTIPVGGQQQFAARAFDASDDEIAGMTFTWSSSNTAVATVDQNGLATGVGTGTTTIKATAGGKSGTATLTVVARTVIINEVLADPPEGPEGDANRDGVRDSADDEFVELVNALSTSASIAGWTISTRSLTGTTETVRHTFAAGTTVPAGSAIVVFGGGAPNDADPAFGGSQVVKASTGRLSLTNSGMHVILRSASGNLVAQFTYGSGAGLSGDSNQSLTRSPDITGGFVLHTAATNAAGRVFSPGTRVDGTPFGSPPITRIEVTPAAASNNIGAKRTFTARAFSNAGGPEVEVLNVSFIWDSSNPNVASVSPQTGRTTTTTALSGGSTVIRARAGGQEASATLTVNFPAVARVEVTPETATIPVGGQQQFTARAFDAGNDEIAGMTFTWSSSNTNVATVDGNGVATGVGTGTTTIKASAGGKNDTAALTVVARTVTINEVLADPPDGLAGDANRDGVRDSADDEFVELVNALNTSVDLSGWTIRTRSLSGTTETVRHTFDAGTTLPAGQAIVVFGGGTINPSDPNFGGAQVLTTSTSGLSLTNSGLHVVLRDAAGNVVAQLTYGSAANLNGDANQSLTRSPDITGDFAPHTTAANSDGRRFSPGTRLDGTPFGSPPITRIEVTPASASVYPGDTQGFTAKAFSNAGGPEVEVQNVSFFWDSSDAAVATVAPETGQGTTATAIAPGTATIRARAGGQADTSALTVNPVVASVELEPASASVPATSTRTFTATARDAGGNVISGITFNFSLRDASPADAAAITGTTANTVTVRGDNEGSVTVVASYTRPNDNVTLEDTSLLTITAPPPRVTSVEVSPSTATINRGQTQQFTATAFDGSTPVSGVTYTWTSSDTAVAAVDQNGLATGVGIGTTTITVTAPDGLGGTVSDTATLNVQVPLVINEILADPPAGTTGDANRDGTSSTSADEFVEVVNNSNAPVDVSGVVLSDATQNRFTFPANTILAANQAAVIFGGGSPNASDPNFGGALIFTAGSLVLNNDTDTVTLKLNVGGTDVVIDSKTYDTTDPDARADQDQSLTRSPDLTGAFIEHMIPADANNRRFSPGTRLDGTPFGSPAITRIEVTPASATIDPGQTQGFTAKAFSDAGGPEVEIQNVSFVWESSNTGVATVSPTQDVSTTATATGPGSTNIIARAGGQQGSATLNVNSPPPVLTSVTISPTSATVGVGGSQQFTAQALDQFNQPIGGVTITFASDNTTVATVDSVSPTSGTGSATATVTGHAVGTAHITATANDGSTSVTSNQATLTVAQVANAGDIVISEFRFRGSNGANDEFIELYNRTTSSIPIGGYKIYRSNTTGTRTLHATINAGKVIGPGCYYLLTNSNATGPYNDAVAGDQTYGTGVVDEGGIAFTLPSSDGITGIIDQVGLSSGSAYKEGTPLTLPSPSSNIDRSFERKPGGAAGSGQDTDNNTADFSLINPSGPQNSSSGCVNTSTADLAVTKADSPDPVITGENVTYTITVTNNGPGVAQSVVVTDNLPADVTFVSCNATGGGVCGGTGNNRTVTFSSLSVGASATVTLVATANSAGGTTITNTASVSSATTDPNDANDSDTETTDVAAQPGADLSLTKTDSPDPVNAGENITYTLTVTNNTTTVTAQNVTVTDATPAGTTLVSVGTLPAGWSRTDTVPAGGTGAITFQRATMPGTGAESTAVFTITVKVDQTAANNSAVSNTANVASDNDDVPDNNSDTETTTVRTPADLEIAFIQGPGGVNVGGEISISIRLENDGPFDATGVAVHVDYPAGLEHVSHSQTQQFDPDTGVWTVGTLAAGSATSIGITFKVLTAGNKEITAEVSASDQFDPDSTPNNDDPDEDDQKFFIVFVHQADLEITKTVDNATPTVGDNVVFTVSLDNAAGQPATGVQVTDQLPAGLAYVSHTASQGTYDSNAGVWTVGSVPSNVTPTLTITANVTATGTHTNTAEVTASEVFDPDSTPNNHNAAEDDQDSASVTAGQVAQADLSLTKAVNNATPNIGERATFTVKLSNGGTDPATGVQVTDQLPAGLTYVSSTVTQGSYDSNTGVWTVGSVAVGTDVATLTITATVQTPGAKTNTAEVTASGVFDPDSTPNNHNAAEDDQASTTVTGASNLIINEAVVAPPASGVTDPNDFVELYNKSTQSIDISGLVISYRPSGAGTTPRTFTLPANTIIPAGEYRIIVNGSSAYGTAADFNASAGIDFFNLNNSNGGIKIELNGVKLDGLAYRSGAGTVTAPFDTYGEGNPFLGVTASGLQDLIRSPNGADTNDNATDFRRNGTAANVSERASNPTTP